MENVDRVGRPRRRRPASLARAVAAVTGAGARCFVMATVVMAVAGAGCSTILAVDEQQELLDSNAVVGGSVRMQGREARGPLVVGIVAKSAQGFHLVDHFVTEKGGSWVLTVASGTYWVMAFEDANANGRYDDEPAYRPDEKDSITLSAGEHRIDLALAIPEDGRFVQKEFSLAEAQLRGREQQQSFSLYALSVVGEVASLDDPRFDEEIAREGMWQPYNFLLRAHPGIYFLEPYDPARVPVLFVHGIGGTPVNFRQMIAGLDRTRYQAWVAYYPTGARLENVGRWMTQLFTRLRTRYRLRKAALVAHSMGGLVSRGFLFDEFATNGAVTDDAGKDDAGTNGAGTNGAGTNGAGLFRTFVTISSPLGGMESAGKGVKDSPVVVRSWYGLAPGSDFLDGLFYSDLPARKVRRRLPGHIAYHMLFGFRGKDADDGVVALSSQLRPEAQQEALSLRGFDETHTGILAAPAAIARVNEILGEMR